MAKITPSVNKEKVDFYTDLVYSNPECLKCINAMKNAANKTIPDKVTAKNAYKEFKVAFKKLEPEKAWKDHLREQKKLKD